MATIPVNIAANDTAIRNKNTPDSIIPANVSDRLDAAFNEFINRGLKVVANTAALAAIDGTDGTLVYVQGVGFYLWTASIITPDALIFFAGSTGTWAYQLSPQVFFNSNTFSDWSVRNTSTGTGAWAGIRFYNVNGIGAQLGYGSPLNATGNNLFLVHCVPGSVRLASNNAAVEFATGNNNAAAVKGGVRANGLTGSPTLFFILPTFADNAAAVAGGLSVTDVYKTATGEVRIVV